MTLFNYHSLYFNKNYINFYNYWFNISNSMYHKNKFFFLQYTLVKKSQNIIILNLSQFLITYYQIYFIKKESFYTKLKYSRVAQFDISSGACAALLSSFYGFLICEKFGFELIDSGDFLYFILYIILFSLVIINFLKILDGNVNLTFFISYWCKSFK